MSETALKLLPEEEQKSKFLVSETSFPSTYAGKIRRVVVQPPPEPNPAKYWVRTQEPRGAITVLATVGTGVTFGISTSGAKLRFRKSAEASLRGFDIVQKAAGTYHYIAPKQRLAGAWLSSEAAQHVADYRSTLEPETAAATGDLVTDSASMVEREVWGLIRSLASVLCRSGAPATYAIGTSGRFTSAVGKAILFRIPLDLFASLDFLNTLYRDFTEAVAAGKLPTDGWRIELTAGGDATLVSSSSRRKSDIPMPGPNWVRTEAISLADLRKQ